MAGIMVLTLQGAQTAVANGNTAEANVLLKAFVDQVLAVESAKLLTAAQAAVLIQEANAL